MSCGPISILAIAKIELLSPWLLVTCFCLACVLHLGVAVLRTRPGASQVLGRHSATELCPQLLPAFYLLKQGISKLPRLILNL